MKTNRVAAAFFVLFLVQAVFVQAADNILGLYKQMDDKSGKPETIVLLYSYQGKIFGRMMASYDETTGAIKDTIYEQKSKAEKLEGDPAYCGMDYLYNLEDKGKEYRGEIIDPRDGKVYDCRIWRDSNKLIVRGQLKTFGFLLGRNQTWLAASATDLPADFVMPDPATFVPVIPKAKKK